MGRLRGAGSFGVFLRSLNRYLTNRDYGFDLPRNGSDGADWTQGGSFGAFLRTLRITSPAARLAHKTKWTALVATESSAAELHREE
jgi:hypothetical protein